MPDSEKSGTAEHSASSTSGVRRTDVDTYTVTVSASLGRGGIAAAKGMAYDAAGTQCGNRKVQKLNETARGMTWTGGMAHVTLDFKCVPG